LLRKTPEAAVNGDGILQHSQRHALVVRALQFDVDECFVQGLAEQIGAPAAYFRQVGVMPAGYLKAGQARENAAVRPGENALQRDIVFVPPAKS